MADRDPRAVRVVKVTRQAGTGQFHDEPSEGDVSESQGKPYPLMRDDQADRLAQIREVFADVGRQLPRLADRRDVKDLNRRLDELQALMSLKCLRIGMLGSSGAGKSTTISNLLDVSEDEGPTPPGGGGAGTGVATRIRPAPPGSTIKMRLEFMTREEYSHRLSDLASLVPELGDAEPGELLPRARALPRESPARPEEVRSLIALLQAHQAHESLLGTVDESVPYERRAQVLMHPPAGAPPGIIPLLSQVVIDWPLNQIDPWLDLRLELIDLPGLGVANRADEKLTMRFMPELNGAFLFIKAAAANDEQVARLIEEMKRRFPNLGPRVWVIASGFDSLDANNLGEGPAGRTVLSYLSDYLLARGVHEDRVLLLGNHLYQALLYARQRPGPPPEAPPKLNGALIDEASQAKNLKINLPRDPAGRLIVPPRFTAHPRFAEAFEKSVLVDGGIGRLRQTIKAQVFDAVQGEVQRQVDDELKALTEDMIQELESARLRSHMDPSDLIRASQWRSDLEVIGRNALQRERSLYIDEAVKLESTFVNYIDSAVRSDLLIQDPDHPGTNMLDLVHRQHCTNLRELGLNLAPDLVKSIYDRIEKRVAAIAVEKLGTGPPGLRDPIKVWTDRTAIDRKEPSWYRPVFESFHGPMVFVPDLQEAGPTYPRDDYRELMKHKSQAVTREFVRQVLARLATHFKKLGDELLLIGENGDSGDAVANALYTELIARLDGYPGRLPEDAP